MTSYSIEDIHKETSTRWTEEEDGILKDNYNLPLGELKKLLPNRTCVSIKWRVRDKLGLKRKRRVIQGVWSENDIQFLIKNYGGMPWEELEERLGKNRHAIREYARRKKIRSRRDEHGRTAERRSRSSLENLLNESFQTYYWVGYLMADGYYFPPLAQIVLTSAGKDKEHLEKYATFLGTTAKLYYRKGGMSEGFENAERLQVRVSVADSVFGPKVQKKFDWNQQKTYNPPEVKVIEAHLEDEGKFMSFFIGFTDGDGYINKKNGRIKIELHASWIFVLKFFAERFVRMGWADVHATINKNGYAEITFGGKVSALLKKFITDNGLVVLERKWKTV